MVDDNKKAVLKLHNRLMGLTYKFLGENKITSKDKGGFELQTEFNENQRYVVNLYKTYAKLLNTSDKLGTIVRLLKIKPSIYFSNEAGLKYSKYLEYNLENFIFRITSIVDLSVILVSDFYNLGIPPKDTTLRHLKGNSHTKETEAVKVIVKYDKEIQKIRQVRNLIAHRGEFIDEDIMTIEANLYMLREVEDKKGENPIFDKMYELVDELIDKKVKFTQENYVGTKKFIFTLDHVLFSDFENKKKDLFESIES